MDGGYLSETIYREEDCKVELPHSISYFLEVKNKFQRKQKL
jgi:hypothetical protein